MWGGAGHLLGVKGHVIIIHCYCGIYWSLVDATFLCKCAGPVANLQCSVTGQSISCPPTGQSYIAWSSLMLGGFPYDYAKVNIGMSLH